MSSINDLILQKLSSYTGTVDDRLLQFYESELGETGLSLYDAEYKYLLQQTGASGGTLQDLWDTAGTSTTLGISRITGGGSSGASVPVPSNNKAIMVGDSRSSYGVLGAVPSNPNNWTGASGDFSFEGIGTGVIPGDYQHIAGHKLDFVGQYSDFGSDLFSAALDDMITVYNGTGAKIMFIMMGTNDPNDSTNPSSLGSTTATPSSLARVANNVTSPGTVLGNFDKLITGVQAVLAADDMVVVAFDIPRSSQTQNGEIMDWLIKHAHDGSEGTYRNLIAVSDVFDAVSDGDGTDRPNDEIQSAFQRDGLHQNPDGSEAGGQALADYSVLTSAFTSFSPRVFEPTVSEATTGNVYSKNVDLSGTSGTKGGGATGDVADDWRLNLSSGGGSVAGSKVTRTINSETHTGQRITFTGDGGGGTTTVLFNWASSFNLSGDSTVDRSAQSDGYILGETWELGSRLFYTDANGLINSSGFEFRLSRAGGVNISRTFTQTFDGFGPPTSEYLQITDVLEVTDPMYDGTTAVDFGTATGELNETGRGKFIRPFLTIVFDNDAANNGLTASVDVYHPMVRNVQP